MKKNIVIILVILVLVGACSAILLINRKDNSVVIDIEDTGIGISEEYLSHLFEPFSQEESGLSRTFEGVGLGLSIVKKLLDLIHAEITVESTKGQGTTFHISLNTTSNSIA